MEGGFYRDPKSHALYPVARLCFRNATPKRKFQRNIYVEFLDGIQQRTLLKRRSFLHLRPGQQIVRLYGSPRYLSFNSLAEAPSILIQIRYQRHHPARIPLPTRVLIPSPRPQAGAWLRLEQAVDGDTLVLKGGERVRLLGVDAPELETEEPGGSQALEFSKARIETSGGRVKLEFDGEDRDAYGRWLAYVWLPDGRMLNEELLRAGLARVYEKAEFKRKKAFLQIVQPSP